MALRYGFDRSTEKELITAKSHWEQREKEVRKELYSIQDTILHIKKEQEKRFRKLMEQEK